MRGISYLSDQVPEADVRRDLTVIRDELHCECVLVKGSDATRQLEAAEIALALGLEVWIEAQRENARPRAALAHLGTVAAAVVSVVLTGGPFVGYSSRMRP